MTGWRLGWMVVPDNLLRTIECLAQNFFISPPTLSQLAAVSIFNCFDELNANVARYARNRNILLAELPKAGFEKIAPPDGAFYLYADVSSITSDSETFCANILAATGVALTPGIDFDARHGRKFVRFSYAGATTDIVEATKRLETSYSQVSHQ
jgi:aspartate/methionine/tyrosine aminotransferase